MPNVLEGAATYGTVKLLSKETGSYHSILIIITLTFYSVLFVVMKVDQLRARIEDGEST